MSPRENRLAGEASPYLRQHRFDPVDWYPYGDEAFERARTLDRPLFFSIGYSTCHWCHVMAHESFSDAETAAEMNETVVAVKVDREERPDVDAIYMEAVLVASGGGGWPMSVFATPDGAPFFAGTYFPGAARPGTPSFRQVLAAVADAWRERRSDVDAQAKALSQAVSRRMAGAAPAQPGVSDRQTVRGAVESAVTRLAEIADRIHGGFGAAPKFPQPLYLDLLLRAHAGGMRAADGNGAQPLEIALEALGAMASGGVYDHLAGGFHRYSVDRAWQVPHFEKMLYDQALLSRAYLHGWQLTGEDRLLEVLTETLDYVLSDLRHPLGALASAEDADSEGEEGRFYLWTAEEVHDVVGADEAAAVEAFYGITEEGNFEGRTILHRGGDSGEAARLAAQTRPPEIERARDALAKRRATRVRPARDDKVLTEWNAMACSVLAETAGGLGEARYEKAAREILEVLLAARERNGARTPRLAAPLEGAAALAGERPGFAADAAWLAEAATRCFELTGEVAYLDAACDVARELVADFVDVSTGAVFTTRAGASVPVVRPTERFDGVVPAASSVSALVLARLAVLTGDESLREAASAIVAGAAALIASSPVAVPELLAAADLLAGGGIEIAANGKGREMLPGLRARFLPGAVYAWLAEEGGETHDRLPLLAGRFEDAVYLCRQGACRLPARTPDEVAEELAALRRPGVTDAS